MLRRTAGRVLGGRGFWALADQGALSLGNFISNYLLLNFLPTQGDYADYAQVLLTILFLNGLHASLVSYPLSLKGATADADGLRRLAGGSLALTGGLLLPLAVILAAAIWLLGRPEVIPWAVAALALWQLQETLRRTLLAKLQNRRALFGDAVSFLGQALAIGALAATHTLTLETALAAVALTSGAACLVQWLQVRALPSAPGRLPALAGEYWTFGRWLLLINLMTLVTIQAMPWTLRFMHGSDGAEEVAHFQSLSQLMGVTNPVLTSVVGLIVPAVAMRRREAGAKAAARVTLDYAALGAGLLLPFFLILAAFPGTVLWFYTHGHHDAYAHLTTPLRLFVLAYALMYPAQIVAAVLNGLGRSRSTFVAQVAFAAATLSVSLPLAATYGLAGAVWGGLFPPVVFLAVSLWMLRRSLAEDDAVSDGAGRAAPVSEPSTSPEVSA